jgi:uncharacterized protein (DUF2147 family)
MKKMGSLALLLSLLTLSPTIWAQMTPVGTWHTVDDETGKLAGEIKITDKGNGEVLGLVVRSLAPPNEREEANCTLCSDDRKDKPKLGMEIIRAAKQTQGTTMWEGGNILDPNNGKVYKLRLMPLDGGAKLQVRGYIGPFYRTQTWIRVNPSTPSN